MADCSIDGCDGTAKTRGWCQAHYMRWRATGDVGPALVVRRTRGRTCSVEGCSRPHRGRGFCDGHLRRYLSTGVPGPAEFEPRRPGATCSVEGCDGPHAGRGLCDKHLQRLRSTGDPLTPLPERGPTWTGDNATYNAVHLRLRIARGPAANLPCAHCGGTADHWAYDHAEPNERRDEKGRPYSTDLARYLPLCKTCHRRFDVEHMTRTRGCSIEGCERPHKAKTLCSAHYQAERSTRTADTAL